MANKKTRDRRCRGCRHLRTEDFYCKKYQEHLNIEANSLIHIEKCKKCIHNYLIKCKECIFYGENKLYEYIFCTRKHEYYGDRLDKKTIGCVLGEKEPEPIDVDEILHSSSEMIKKSEKDIIEVEKKKHCEEVDKRVFCSPEAMIKNAPSIVSMLNVINKIKVTKGEVK